MNDNNNEISENESQVNTIPVEENDKNTKKKKFPFVIILLLFLVLAGYFLFSNKDMIFKNKEGERETPTEDTQVVDKEDEKDNSSLEEEKKETNNTEDKKDSSNNTSESSNTGSQENTNDQNSSTTPDNSFQDSSEVLIEPSGTRLYLYEESYIGMDNVGFQHISSTVNSITVDVIINEDTQRYTIPFGQETKINHLKNLIVVNEVTEDSDNPYYSITFK